MNTHFIKEPTEQEINQVIELANDVFMAYSSMKPLSRAKFLLSIAKEIEHCKELIPTAMEESNLPEQRMMKEKDRTIWQLKMFAELIMEGSWVMAKIDRADPHRMPPKPDIRKMSIPMGVVVVFGAANFPLAYSTIGGDTASALAAGCPVVVKAHEAHPRTSKLVADAIERARIESGVPQGTFQQVYGQSHHIGQLLVTHPLVQAVGFTGSLKGGKSLFDLISKRAVPIPFFAEMSSTNPVILLPDSLASSATETAEQLAASLTLNVGQFCTCPGLIFAVEGEALNEFVKAFVCNIDIKPEEMLHEGISRNYQDCLDTILNIEGVRLEGQSTIEATTSQGRPVIVSVSAKMFIENKTFHQEVFGPFTCLVRCDNMNQLLSAVKTMHGQLTMTVIGEAKEVKAYPDLLNIAKQKCGRLIYNGVPTGVEVCGSMMHGGPYPATTDSRFTAVGTDAINRFVRPIAYQNYPEALLPDELKDDNPLGIRRMEGNQWVSS